MCLSIVLSWMGILMSFYGIFSTFNMKWHAGLKGFLMFSTGVIVTNMKCMVTLLTPCVWGPVRSLGTEPLMGSIGIGVTFCKNILQKPILGPPPQIKTAVQQPGMVAFIILIWFLVVFNPILLKWGLSRPRRVESGDYYTTELCRFVNLLEVMPWGLKRPHLCINGSIFI